MGQNEVERYAILDQEIQRINAKWITPDDDRCKEAFLNFFDALRKKLYEVEPFLNQYKLATYAGSVFAGLAVGKSYNEFDTNIHIKLDTNILQVRNIYKSPDPGFVMLKTSLTNNSGSLSEYTKVINQWLDEEGYIVPAKFSSWGQSVIDRMKNATNSMISGRFRFNVTKSGPALTLHVKDIKSDLTFDVDVVFAFSFDKWVLDNRNSDKGEWIAVAKLPSGTPANSRNWRYSFPKFEQEKLTGHAHLKNAIRLIKRVRDVNEIDFLSSYYIKTLFMLELDDSDEGFWESSISYIFVTMLYRVHRALDTKQIKSYMDPKFNLIDHCDQNQVDDGCNKIMRVIEEIENICDTKNVSAIHAIFKEHTVENNNKKLESKGLLASYYQYYPHFYCEPQITAEMIKAQQIKRYKSFDCELYSMNVELTDPCKAKRNRVSEAITEFFSSFCAEIYRVEPFLKNHNRGEQNVSLKLPSTKLYNEFDINIHIKLNSDVLKIENVHKSSTDPGCVILKTKIANDVRKDIEKMKVYNRWLDRNGNIVPAKFLSWGQSMLDRLRNTTQCNIGGKYHFGTFQRPGPAFSLHVKAIDSDVVFNVDIVFALSFDMWPFGERNGGWLAVIKQPDETPRSSLDWRYSFPDDERQKLNNDDLTDAIRLIKRVRDVNSIKFLSTYHIKNLVIREIDKAGEKFWEGSIGYLFVTMLCSIRNALERREIESYFVPGLNLLSPYNTDLVKKGHVKIVKLIERIEKLSDSSDVSMIREIFEPIPRHKYALEILKIVNVRDCKRFLRKSQLKI